MEEIRDISKADNNHNLAVYLDSAVGNSRAMMSWHDKRRQSTTQVSRDKSSEDCYQKAWTCQKSIRKAKMFLTDSVEAVGVCRGSSNLQVQKIHEMV